MGQLKTYGSDLTDAEWQRIAPLLPADKPVGRLLTPMDGIIYMFGDMGIAHVLQCKTHKDQFAFVWACG